MTKAEWTTDMLGKYSEETGISPPTPDNLSPLEQWLILHFFAKLEMNKYYK